MKKLLMGLGLVVLLAGCASRENGNGMGGTSDDSMKTDSYNTGSASSNDQMPASTIDRSGSPTAPAVNNGVGTP